MTKTLDVMTLEMVGEVPEPDPQDPWPTLTPESAVEYFRASMRVASFLEKAVLEPVKTALKERSGLAPLIGAHPLTKVRPYETRLDSVTFTVTPKEATSYKDVYNALGGYLTTMEQEKRSGKQMPCVRTFRDRRGKNALYIELDDVLGHIDAFTDDATKYSSLDVDEVQPSRLKGEKLERLAVSLMDYGALPSGAGMAYVRAKRFAEDAKRRAVTPFEKALKMAAGHNDDIPDRTVTPYLPVGEHVFGVKCVPSDNPPYGDAIDALIYETPTGKVTKKTGDLVLMRDGVEDPRVAIYDQRRDGKLYISLDGLKTRLKELAQPKRELRKYIASYPVV